MRPISGGILGVVSKGADAGYPDAAQVAVATMLRLCPELAPAWADLCSWMDSEDPVEVGIYNIICQIVCPAIALELGLFDYSGASTGGDFAARMYQVLDEWIASGNPTIVEAVGVEFGGGWGGWTAEVSLSGPTGPRLRDLIGPGSPHRH